MKPHQVVYGVLLGLIGGAAFAAFRAPSRRARVALPAPAPAPTPEPEPVDPFTLLPGFVSPGKGPLSQPRWFFRYPNGWGAMVTMDTWYYGKDQPFKLDILRGNKTANTGHPLAKSVRNPQDYAGVVALLEQIQESDIPVGSIPTDAELENKEYRREWQAEQDRLEKKARDLATGRLRKTQDYRYTARRSGKPLRLAGGRIPDRDPNEYWCEDCQDWHSR